MGLDLSQFASSDEVESRGLRFDLLDESGEPYDVEGKPITCTVYGTYSKAFIKKNRSLDGASTRTPAQREAIAFERYAAAVKEWDLTADGVMANPELIFAHKPHIFEQVIMKANDHGAHLVAFNEAKAKAEAAPVAPLVIADHEAPIAA